MFSFASPTFLLKKKSRQKKTNIGRNTPFFAFFWSFSFAKEKDERKKRTSEKKEEPFFVKRQRMAKKTFSRGSPLENPPSSPTLRCVGEGLVGETAHPKASTTAFGWFCIGMREGEFCERFRPLVLSKGRINRKEGTIERTKARMNPQPP